MIDIIKNGISPYSIFIGIGFVVSMLFIIISRRNDKKQLDNIIYIYVYTSIVGLIGSKILYILVSINEVIADYQTYGFQFLLGKYINGGFVFYGGLIFGYLTAICLLKSYKANYQICVPTLIIAFLINFGFGRLGCLSVGCCHGIETASKLSIIYHNSIFAPNGVRLVPVQLYETIFDFILAFVIYRMSKTIHSPYTYCCVHLYSYSIFRFIIEFFRGDSIRGIWLGLSTSQWTSIVIVVILSIFMLNRKIHKVL